MGKLFDYLSDVAAERTDRIEARQQGRSDRKESRDDTRSEVVATRQDNLSNRAETRGAAGGLLGQVVTAVGPEIAQIAASTAGAALAAQTGNPAGVAGSLGQLTGLLDGGTEEAPSATPAPAYKAAADEQAKTAAPTLPEWVPWAAGLGLAGIIYAASKGRR